MNICFEEKNKWLHLAKYEKPLKNHPLEVAKKMCVETCSLPDPEEGVQKTKTSLIINILKLGPTFVVVGLLYTVISISLTLANLHL